MADVISIGKAELLSQLFYNFSGQKPSMTSYPDYVQLSFSPAQNKAIVEKIKLEMSKKHAPGDVRIDLNPIVLPLLLNKGVPYALGILGAGILIGFIIRGKFK